MAANDILLFNPNGLNQPASITFKTEANGTDILVGEPVQIGGTGGNFVIPLADGEPTTSELMLGVAASNSTHTASANGEVEVVLALPGVVFEAMATTPANIDTEAKLLAILNDRVAFDLANGVYTVDENEGDDSAHGLRIVGGDISTGKLYFVVRESATNLN